MPATPAETDPSVCYRHPDRTSWTLCSRCGRTICPECQILTPSGVRCPECVREEGGSVRWEPAAQKTAKPKKTGMRRPALAERVDSATRPVITIGVGATALVLWFAGFFAGPGELGAGAIFDLLNARPEVALQVWRYATTALAYPAVGSAGGVLSALLGIAIFVWIGWGAERFLGWRRYAIVLLTSSVAAAALCVLALGSTYGLTGAVWGIFGAYLVVVWDQPTVRNRLLITMAIWFIFSLFFGNIIAVIGGAAAGIGTVFLLRRYDDRPRSRPSTPYLLLAAGLGVLIVLAILSSTVVSPLT